MRYVNSFLKFAFSTKFREHELHKFNRDTWLGFHVLLFLFIRQFRVYIFFFKLLASRLTWIVPNKSCFIFLKTNNNIALVQDHINTTSESGANKRGNNAEIRFLSRSSSFARVERHRKTYLTLEAKIKLHEHLRGIGDQSPPPAPPPPTSTFDTIHPTDTIFGTYNELSLYFQLSITTW